MMSRCYDEGNVKYKLYGARGVRVCGEWHDFGAFLSAMGERPSRTSLDRVDNNGNYEPGNCRWASAAEQARNTRRNRWIDFDGQRRCLADWADHLGLDRRTLTKRLRLGWSIERALATPTMVAYRRLAHG